MKQYRPFNPPEDLKKWAAEELEMTDKQIDRLREEAAEEDANAELLAGHMAAMANPDDHDPLFIAWLLKEDLGAVNNYTWKTKLQYAVAGAEYARHKLGKALQLKAIMEKALS